MTVRGVRYRLFRSIITVVVITVAIAFLMNIVTESLVKQALAENSRKRVQELRLGISWLTRLTVPPSEDELIALLSTAKPGDSVFRETMNFAGLNQESARSLVSRSDIALKLLRFFEDLDYGRRRLLVGRAWGVETFETLGKPDTMAKFQIQYREMRGLRFPVTMEEFSRFIQDWPAYRATLNSLREGWSRSIEQVRSGAASLPIALSDEAFAETVRKAGFVIDAGEARMVAGQMRRIQMQRDLERVINSAELARAIAARMNILPREVTLSAIWKLLNEEGGAEWLAGKLHTFQVEVQPEELLQLAAIRKEEQRLARAEQIGIQTGGLLGLGERMTWLILVSLGVCVVGITNAMFMSVTERYREIATMKCLGALDGTIMLIFVLEAAVLGLAGGFAGAVLGTLVAILRLFAGFGTLIAGSFPASTIAVAWLATASLGIFLAAFGAILPSYKAARLAPMEAMRIE